MKMLYILNVANRVNNFCMSSLMAAKELKVEYHIAGNWAYKDDDERKADEQKYGIRIHQVDFERSPISLKNITAYKQLKKIVARERFDVIHCNTPIGGVLGRLVGKKYKVSNVIYQAHGFHFYKGSPKLNWMLYYPIEKWLAHYTDTLITINQEDYELAKSKLRLRNNGQVYYVPGVGIDLSQYVLTKNKELRSSLGINEKDIMLISAGDLVERKNYKVAIQAIAETKLPNVNYCICGKGPQEAELKDYAKNIGVADHVMLLGFRSDIKELLQVADIFLFTTKQEGLPRSMMEAMASGLPCVASKIRGNVDLLEDSVGGYLCEPKDVETFAKYICMLADDAELRHKQAQANLERIKDFDVEVVKERIREIYQEVLSR